MLASICCPQRHTHLFTHSYATVCLFRGYSQYNGVSASLELRASRRRSATRSSSTFRLVLWYAALAHTLRSRDLIRVHDSSADVNVLRVVHGALGARGSTVGYCSSLVASLSLSLQRLILLYKMAIKLFVRFIWVDSYSSRAVGSALNRKCTAQQPL